MKNYKCTCGDLRPYRRAYACKKCWAKLSDLFKSGIVTKRSTKNQGPGSLSLRSVHV